MTIAERRDREAYDQLNPWRPIGEAKADGTVCELLFNDMVGGFDAERFRYFLDLTAAGIGSIRRRRSLQLR